MNTEPQPTAELLAEHVGWIRELARQLVSDPASADDLAQDACVVALSHAPRDDGRLRSWLASVLRNLARQRGRSEGRRRVRESLVAHPEATDSTDRLVERIAVQRELVEAVLDLAQPYRDAILLRFFEDLPPREIARRSGAPIATVHSRIARGLRELRQRLDRTHGERRSWLALLTPLVEPPRYGAPTLGTLLVNAKITLAVVSLVALVTVAAVATIRAGGADAGAPPRASNAASPLAATDERSQPTLPETERGASSDERAAVAPVHGAPDRAPTTPATASAIMRTVRGRVIGADGTPVAGVEVAVPDAPIAERTRSGAGGRFEMKTTAAALEIEATSPLWTNVRSGSWLANSTIDPLVIVAPAIDIGGQVVDPMRQPLSHARVTLNLPPGFETRFTENLEATHVLGWHTLTDADGHFTLAHIPQIAGARVTVVADGYQSQTTAQPEVSDPNLVFVLARPRAPLAGALRGRVSNESGAPVPQARVALGLTSTLTGPNGEFAIEFARAVTADRLTAVKAGFRPAEFDRPEDPTATTTGWPDYVELRLGAPSLSISGRVVDAAGKPRPGLRLWIADPTSFGVIGRVPVQLENLMAGAAVPPAIVASEPDPGDSDGDNFMDQFMHAGPSTAFWSWVATDADGRFEIQGLDERRYKLRAMDDATLVVFTSEPIRAGSQDVKIEWPEPALFPRVAGRVVGSRGRPIAGVTLALRREAFGLRTRVFGGTAQYGVIQPRESTTTDVDGRFEFKDVPRDGIALDLSADGIVPSEHRLEGEASPASLELVVHTRCRLEVRLEPPLGRADRIALRDADGAGLDVLMITQGSVNAYTDAALIDGRSGVVSVSSAARTLVLMKGKEVVETHPIDLAPDEINVLAF